MKTTAIVFTDVQTVVLQKVDLPAPGPHQAIVETIYSGVSTGTETRVLNGGQTGAQFPLIPGYENVGRIIETGEGVDLQKDNLVFHTGSIHTAPFQKCWGAHMQHALVDEVSMVHVPSGLDPQAAIFTKVGAIALRGVKRARVQKEDVVAVVGLGLIGHWAAQGAKAFGATVIGVDRDEQRLEYAKAAGIDGVVNAAKEAVEQRVKELSGGGVTVAIDATGVASAVDQTARLVRDMPWAPPYPPSPRVVVLGSTTRPIALEYDHLFMNEVDVLFSRDTRREDLEEMLALLADGRVNPNAIPVRRFDWQNAPDAYAQLLKEKWMRLIFAW